MSSGPTFQSGNELLVLMTGPVLSDRAPMSWSLSFPLLFSSVPTSFGVSSALGMTRCSGQPHVHILAAWQAQDKGNCVFFQQKIAPRGLLLGSFGSQDISESFLGSERRQCSSWCPPERGGPGVEGRGLLEGEQRRDGCGVGKITR